MNVYGVAHVRLSLCFSMCMFSLHSLEYKVDKDVIIGGVCVSIVEFHNKRLG